MGKRIEEWKRELRIHKRLISISIALFIIANIINQLAGHYVDKKASAAVSDTVLAMHDHYSIDVFAAFFITYGSFKIGNRVFRRISRDY